MHWNINIRNNKFLYEKIKFVKKNSFIVARLVSFDTAGLHLRTYPSIDIEIGLSHVISH